MEKESLESRIARQEQAVYTLEQSLSSLADSVRHGFETLHKEVSSIRSQPTNWGWIVGGVSLVITIGALTLTPIYTRISNAETNFQKHQELLGHPALNEKVAALRKISDLQDEILQGQVTDLERRQGKIAERFYNHQQEKGERL